MKTSTKVLLGGYITIVAGIAAVLIYVRMNGILTQIIQLL